MTELEYSRLNIADAVALGTIIGAAQRGDRIHWLTDAGHVLDGVARAITRDGGGFLTSEEDVRDGYLWVSSMLEWWLPVRVLIEGVHAGAVAFEARP